jgi:hypothetical protein
VDGNLTPPLFKHRKSGAPLWKRYYNVHDSRGGVNIKSIHSFGLGKGRGVDELLVLRIRRRQPLAELFDLRSAFLTPLSMAEMFADQENSSRNLLQSSTGSNS